MKKILYNWFCNSLATSLSTLRVNAIRWLVLATLALASQAQTQSNELSDPEKTLMDAMNAADAPSASIYSSAELQEQRRMLIAKYGEQSPQVATVSKILAYQQKWEADSRKRSIDRVLPRLE